MSAAHVVPESPCHLGYPRDAVEQIFAENVARFDEWMRGQTVAICDGRRFDHEAAEYEPTNCGPHGVVVYEWDLRRYLAGGGSW